jgi:hypothetical protein
MLNLILTAIVVGSTAAGFALALRALPVIRNWVESGIKPWACDICLGFWSTLVVALVYWIATGAVLASVGPAYPICLGVIKLLSAPKNVPMFPEE